MKTTDKKDYTCVKSVRKERERIAKETKNKSPQEILEYFRKRKEERKNQK